MVVRNLINIDKIQDNLERIQKEMNSVLEKFNESVFGNYKRPAINISQNSNFFLVSIEMPGLNKDNINIRVYHNNLEVIGERRRKLIKKLVKGSSYKGYKASIGLPPHLLLDKIKAEYTSNFLKISVPKMKTKIGSRVNIK